MVNSEHRGYYPRLRTKTRKLTWSEVNKTKQSWTATFLFLFLNLQRMGNDKATLCDERVELTWLDERLAYADTVYMNGVTMHAAFLSLDLKKTVVAV